MNWRRGLFRLWIVGAALFVIAVAAVSYSDIKAELDAASIFEVKLPDGRVYEVQAPDRALAEEAVRKLGPHTPPPPPGFVIDGPKMALPWVRIGLWAGIASGIPLAVLILGASLVWAFSGFATRP